MGPAPTGSGAHRAARARRWVCSVAFSPDGQTLASGSEDKTIRLWDLRQPAAAPTVLRGHEQWVSSVAFSPDGQTLASGSTDKTIRLWDLRQPAAAPTVLRGHEHGSVRCLQSRWADPGLRQCGTRYGCGTCATGSGATVLRGTKWVIPLPSVQMGRPWPQAVRIRRYGCGTCANRQRRPPCCAGTNDGSAPLPSVQMGRPWPQAVRITRYGCGTCANRQRRLPCCAGTKMRSSPLPSVQMGRPWPQAVRITRYGCGTCANRQRRPPCCAGTSNGVFSVAFSPDGQTLASGSADNTIRLWDLRQPAAAPTVLRGHEICGLLRGLQSRWADPGLRQWG